MTESVLSHRSGLALAPKSVLKAAATFWFSVTAFGQWLFVLYILGYYGSLFWQRGLESLSETHLPNGFVAGDSLGNATVVSHLLLAAVIMGLGSLQLIPQIRAHFPVFHRWSGRLYVLTAVISSIAGLFIVWGRGTVGGPVQHYAISVDAVLIIVFSANAVRHAIVGDFRLHRRWALRLFMVVSGVWFYRVSLMAWVFFTGGAGIDFESFTGPFLDFLAIAQYGLPLVVLECYFRTQDRPGARNQMAMATGLVALTLVMAVGIVAAAMGMWIPRL